MKDATIRIRLTAEQKAIVEAAAKRLGITVTAFVTAAVMKEARKGK